MKANYVKHSIERRRNIAEITSLNHSAHTHAGLIVYQAKWSGDN